MLRTLVVAVVLALPALAGAQDPKIYLNPGSAGEYIIELETPPILDYTYHGPAGPGTTLDLVQDLDGNVVGHSKTSGITITSEAVIKGKVKTADGLPYVKTTTIDDGEIDGEATHTVAKLRASLQGWGAGSTLIGDIHMKFCLTTEDPITQRKRRICLPNQTHVAQAMPHVGTWQVWLSLERFGDTVAGLGWVVTGSADDSTARIFEADAYGKISPTTGLVKLVVRPQKPSPGTITLIGELTTDAGGAIYFAKVREVKGKLLGQSFDEVFAVH